MIPIVSYATLGALLTFSGCHAAAGCVLSVASVVGLVFSGTVGILALLAAVYALFISGPLAVVGVWALLVNGVFAGSLGCVAVCASPLAPVAGSFAVQKGTSRRVAMLPVVVGSQLAVFAGVGAGMVANAVLTVLGVGLAALGTYYWAVLLFESEPRRGTVAISRAGVLMLFGSLAVALGLVAAASGVFAGEVAGAVVAGVLAGSHSRAAVKREGSTSVDLFVVPPPVKASAPRPPPAIVEEEEEADEDEE